MDVTAVTFVKMDKAFRKSCCRSVKAYGFTPNEVEVLLFLMHNPEHNSARDLVHYRGISKGLVAKSVESLVERGFLSAVRDQGDQRLINLFLTEKSGPVLHTLQDCEASFREKLFDGITPKEEALMKQVSGKIRQNLERMIE